MLIRNYSETRPHALPRPRPGEYVLYIVRPQYECRMYKVTQSLQQSLPGYSCPAGHGVFTVITPPRSTMFNALLQCRIYYVVPHRAEACNSLPRMTKVSNEIGLYIALTVDALLYSVHVSCTLNFHALY